MSIYLAKNMLNKGIVFLNIIFILNIQFINLPLWKLHSKLNSEQFILLYFIIKKDYIY